MLQIILRPQIHKFSSCVDFASNFHLGAQDLILTNRYIYEPYFGKLNLECMTIFQEDYGTGEPTDVMAEQIISDVFKLGKFCRIIAIGGGTVIDLAKAIAVCPKGKDLDQLYCNPSKLQKYYDLVLVPTTCGTGSEMTNVAVFNRVKLDTKMGLVSDSMYADHAVLVPELLNTLPYHVFATSSIDALVHAVESCLSPRATSYSKIFGYNAIESILHGYQALVKYGFEYRSKLMENFLVASNYAGISFGTAGCAAVHAMAYPLGGMYHISHGESNYVCFTHVLRAYMHIKRDGEMAVLNEQLSNILQCDKGIVYDSLDELLNKILPKKTLREYGVTQDDLKPFADNVVKTQQRLMTNAFTPLSFYQILKIYQDLY